MTIRLVIAADIAEGVSLMGEVEGHVAVMEPVDLPLVHRYGIQLIARERIADLSDLLREGTQGFWVMVKKSASGVLSGDGQQCC